jgi:4-amino-4-deoxy-L-arabinose transferase-like glycosyltransferase
MATLFSLALGMRLLALGRFVTPDELIWVYRSVLFREALRDGRFAETLVAGHPGVTTTWLGTLAISIQLLLRPADGATYTWITQMAALTPDNMAAFQWLSVFLSGGRTAVAVLNSLGVVAVYALVRRLFDWRVALLAAALLALDPFVAGLSGLLHVDGLLTTGVTLSLLALALGAGMGCRPAGRRERLAWTAAAGALAALSVLSKTPALLLLPVVALTLASGVLRDRDLPPEQRLGQAVLLGAVWLGSFLLVLFAAFPALWSVPGAVLATVSGNTGRHVEEALRPTFFMGDVAFDHGAAFYPIAVLWRITPLVLVGLAMLGVGLARPGMRTRLNGQALILLGGWVLLFLAMITVAAKKFDRYTAPVFPALIILAAVGLVAWATTGKRVGKGAQGLLAAAAVLQLVMLLFSGPYLLSSYNLLLGGPYVARELLPMGWGEGISASGRWLAGQAGTEKETAVSGIPPSLAPFFPGETLAVDQVGSNAADNLIVTLTGRQEDPQGVAAAVAGFALRHTVRYGLLEQAWVYANPEPDRNEPQIVPAENAPSFGGQMQLAGQALQAVEGGDVRFTARWQRLAANSRPLVVLTLRDEQGAVWNRLETAVLNETYFYPPDWQPDEQPEVSYLLKLPPTVPPGTYVLDVSLLDGESGSLLPVVDANGEFAGVVFAAGEVAVQTPVVALNPGALGMTAIIDELWADGALRLLGQGAAAERGPAGGSLPLEVFWQGLGPLPAGLQVAWQLGEAAPVLLPLSRYDSGLWEEGRTLLEKYRLPIPPEMRAGSYALTLELRDAAGRPFGEEKVTLGDIRVDTIERLFDLPEDIAVPLETRFAQGITLRGVSPAALIGEPGGTLPLTLVWQGEGQTAVPVTAFVHVVNEQGEIVAQADRWPGGLPSDVWSAGQVIVDEYALVLPSDLAAGEYTIRVGLYTADDGTRLAVQDQNGDVPDGDHFILPVIVTIDEGQ